MAITVCHPATQDVRCLQVNLYIDPTDFDGLGTLGWCPVIFGREQLGCQEPTIKQLLAMTSGIIPTDNLNCGGPNRTTYTPSDWQWQYRCASDGLTAVIEMRITLTRQQLLG